MSWDKDHYLYKCSGCPEGHNSFWKTIIESPQWKKWEKIANKKGYDYCECSECGWMSQKHFQEFIKFIRK